MAAVKFDANSPEFTMFNEYWKFVQDFYIPEDSDEFWDAFVKAQSDFTDKYIDGLGRYLSNAFVCYLEDKLKEIRKNG